MQSGIERRDVPLVINIDAIEPQVQDKLDGRSDEFGPPFGIREAGECLPISPGSRTSGMD